VIFQNGKYVIIFMLTQDLYLFHKFFVIGDTKHFPEAPGGGGESPDCQRRQHFGHLFCLVDVLLKRLGELRLHQVRVDKRNAASNHRDDEENHKQNPPDEKVVVNLGEKKLRINKNTHISYTVDKH
jgi:hypothetical protein